MGDLPQQSLRSLLNWRKHESGMIFLLLRSTLLPWPSVCFGVVWPFHLANVLDAGGDTLRHKSVSQKRVLLGTFTGITVAGLVITVCALWRHYCSAHNTSHNLGFSPQKCSPGRGPLEKTSCSLCVKPRDGVSTEAKSGSNKPFPMLKISKHLMLKEEFVHKQNQKLRFLRSVPKCARCEDFPSLYLTRAEAFGALMYFCTYKGSSWNELFSPKLSCAF